MKIKAFSKITVMTLAVIMLIGVLSVSALAVNVDYSDSYGGSDYYNVISQREWELAPGIAENEVVLNNDAGTRRQVVHTVAVDLNNPYTKVIPGTKGMWPQEGNYGTEATSVQALNAEKLGYGNVVAATNVCLSWYTEQYYKDHPEMIGEPIGYSILDGKIYGNSQNVWSGGDGSNGSTPVEGMKLTKSYIASNCVVINYDKHPVTGEERPTDMPKVWMRSLYDPLTGWEQQVVPVQFAWLVKPDATGTKGVNVAGGEDHGSGVASRTFIGVRADGTLVVAVSDGEQAPYSTGFTSYEMADYMIKMGCVIAANCDGGGSTTFCTQRPGEDFKVNCSLSDGGERPTANTILIISTAPADGVFARATITSDYDYYTPGSSVTFSALGTDTVGTKVDIPADVSWAIKEEGMGTIENGVFTSNGTEGTVTVQMIYDGNVVGERTITVATPTSISFDQPVVTIPFGKIATIPVKATINNGMHEIGLGANDITFTTTNTALGRFEGLSFVAVDEANAPADITSTVTATLNSNTNLTATVQLKLGKASQILWDFEDGQIDIDEWNVINNRTGSHRDYYMNLSLADRTNGQVHDGDYSMRLEINGLASAISDSGEYAWIRLGVDGDALILENARRIGFWFYVPEDNIQCWVQGHYMTDSNGDGTYDTLATVSMMESENVYYNVDESGWYYLSMDVSAFEKLKLAYSSQFDKDPSDGTSGEKGEFFLAIITHRTKNNLLWQTNGTINGPYTYYLDNFTVDYSEAVDDRENPVFDKIYLDSTALVKRDVITTTNNILNLSAAVADATTLADAMGVAQPLYNVSGLDADTAKVYIDGVEVPSTFANGNISVSGYKVADGYHRIKFEICDKAGNKSVIIRVIKVESGTDDSTLQLVPADPTLDRIPFGSIYWMNLVANKIETIQSVETVIDLNSVNHWQLDHMILTEGFTATYTIDDETNTATITITRTGDNIQTGSAVLAQLPVRIIYFDTDIKVPGFTAETYWTTYNFFPQDMKMDVDKGLITFTNGTTGTFSNEEFHVDTEMYTTNAAIDKTYFAEHGTTHVHTPVSLDDKAPTCTEIGYTGRTFCEGCNSVVEWGTTIPATGHTYTVADDKLVCECGRVSTATGLQNVDGKNYYTVNGKLTNGWITVEDDWYYFDKTTFAGADGEKYADNGVKFKFDNGYLTEGSWVRDAKGIRYWYGPGYYRDVSPNPDASRLEIINGKQYLFNRQGYMQIGVAFVHHNGLDIPTHYFCAEDGTATFYTGPAGNYFYKEGRKQNAYQLLKDMYGDYYFVGDRHMLVKDQKVYLSAKFIEGTDLVEGYYEFGADGKMVIKNGAWSDGFFYIDNVRQSAYKLINYEGNYYFVGDGHKYAKSQRIYLSAKFIEGTDLVEGYYEFGADGKMVIKNGAWSDGFFYIDNVRQSAYKLINYEGNYYFISDGHKYVKNVTVYLNYKFMEGSGYGEGFYTFDSEGKMIIA